MSNLTKLDFMTLDISGNNYLIWALDAKIHLSAEALKNVEKNEKEGQSSKTNGNTCYRYGGKGHWSRTSRTPKHLVDLYKKSMKNKKAIIESHFTNEDNDLDYSNMDVIHLDVGDLFVDPDGKIDHLIEDGSVKK
ncbi:unnamed protein product [Vicia faba]|uniref:Uncharacterized protein n=1 Tax=Vicia faba TaxID=3906 RepID=A0AAV1A4S8_VICFA|nr:unnamed protein product [Vicia faba]